MEEVQTDKRISLKQLFKISWFSFKMYIKPDKTSGILLFIVAIIARLTTMVDFLIIAKIIDIVVKILQNHSTIESVIPYLVFLACFNFVSSLLARARWYLRNKMSQYFYYYSDIFLYEYYKILGVPVMEDPEKNNIIHRGMNEVTQLPSLFFTFIDLIADAVNVIIAGIAIFYFLPKLLWIAAAWVIVRNIPEMKFTKEMYQYGFKNTEIRRLNNHIVSYILNKVSLIELSVHNAADYIKDRYLNFVNKYIDGWLNIRRRMFYYNTGLSFGAIFVYFWIVLNIIGKIIRDNLSVGRLYFYISMVERFESNLDMMFGDLVTLREMSLRIDDTYQFFNLKQSFSDGKIELSKFKKPPEISCRNVCFKYPNTKRLILDNLNLEIKAGEKIAIVGVNGAGKTTLIKLLLRFYQTTDGDILINSDNIDDLKIETYYKNVGTLFQDFKEYGAFSAEENIFVGDVSRGIDEKSIKEAARKSDAHDFINLYPNKYKQILSESFTNGIRPSTGQWQKIAISRLFYRNPWLVIFDEPTASIDAEAEYKIFNNIYNFFKNKTVIIISHRFSTVRNADRIILIDGGHIAEQGTHDELLKLNGKYAKAFKLQAEGYEIE